MFGDEKSPLLSENVMIVATTLNLIASLSSFSNETREIFLIKSYDFLKKCLINSNVEIIIENSLLILEETSKYEENIKKIDNEFLPFIISFIEHPNQEIQKSSIHILKRLSKNIGKIK